MSAASKNPGELGDRLSFAVLRCSGMGPVNDESDEHDTVIPRIHSLLDLA